MIPVKHVRNLEISFFVLFVSSSEARNVHSFDSVSSVIPLQSLTESKWQVFLLGR